MYWGGGDGLQSGSTGSDGGGNGMLVELLETEGRFRGREGGGRGQVVMDYSPGLQGLMGVGMVCWWNC